MVCVDCWETPVSQNVAKAFYFYRFLAGFLPPRRVSVSAENGVTEN
jgi:hypothetical protein